MLRIASGKYKNRKLKVAKQISRPFTEKMRLSVIELLKDHLQNANILDLYAGSGAVGIEALSRGAKFATFVESNKKAFYLIKENLNTLNVEEETEIYNTTASDFIKNSKNTFDIIFLDPPFTEFRSRNAQINIGGVINLCHSDTIIVLRIEKDNYKKIYTQDNFNEVYSKDYGKSTVVFYYPKM